MSSTEQYDVIGARWDEARAMPIVLTERSGVAGLIGDVRGRDVLDLGCGTGSYTRQVRSRGAERVVGTDVSSEMIEVARAKERHERLGVEYRVENAVTHSTGGEFDLVVAVFVLNYARTQAELDEMVSRARRNLAPGGRLVGVAQNPDYAFDGPGTAKYGMEFEREGAHAMGTAVRVTAHTAPPVVFRTSILDRAVYDAAFAAAGFDAVRWTATPVSPAVRGAFERGFWDDFVANPPTALFEARA